MTDFDKLTLEVWTDGTIAARDAVSLGARILCDHFMPFHRPQRDHGQQVHGGGEIPGHPRQGAGDDHRGAGPVGERFNCLKRANINTVEDLISKTEDEMMKVRNLGRKSLEEVINKLAMMGLSLANEDN